MKKIYLFATAIVFSLAAMAQPGTAAQPAATVVAQPKADDFIKFNVETHDFGKVKQSIPVDYFFELKNISSKPVVVENTWGSCGCTIPDKITEPIMPGNTVKLKVQYNAAAAGPISKDVFIKLAGVEQPKTVHISGEVLTAEAYEAYVKEKGETKEVKKN
jgi:hypothetical protein